MLIIQSVQNPVWANAEHTAIKCEIKHNDYGWIPFTASPEDCEAYGREIYANAVAGSYGPIAAYVPPLPPSAEDNKAQAGQKLASTDWVNQPDVYDPLNSPYLTNRDAYISYRSQVRVIAVNPIAGNLDWPTEPTAIWSQ